MQQDLWSTVDEYIAQQLVPEADELEWLLQANAAADLPAIDVSPPLAKLLHLLVKISGARTVLEIGTLGGYSTVWMSRALPPGGRLVTLEVDPKHAKLAQKNLTKAGVSGSVDLRIGLAADSLRQLADEGHPPFDLVFVDADKVSNPTYFEWALKLTKPGSLIVFDNVVRSGEIASPTSDDPSIQGIRRLNELIASSPQVSGTAIQTVGRKGYDGFALLRVHS